MERVGDREDGMMVFDWKQMLLLGFKPAKLLTALAFGAVPVSTRVVRDFAVIAAIALLDVPAKSRSAAVKNRLYNASLSAIEGRQEISALTEDVGQFQYRSILPAVLCRQAWHASALFWIDASRIVQGIERTRSVLEIFTGYVCVNLCRLQAAMAEKKLNLSDVGPAFK